LTESTEGTPQGAVISPLLANIYLHYAYDLWANQWRKREATGEVIVVRYADDTIVGFEREADAERFLRDLRERLAKFGLALHPDKTRLIEFGRYAAQRRSARGLGNRRLRVPRLHAHLREGEGGWFTLVRHTIAKRMRAELVEIKEALNRMRHVPVTEQGRWLGQVVRGYLAYHAVPTTRGRSRPSNTTSRGTGDARSRAEAIRPQVVGADGTDRRALVATRQDQPSLAATPLPRQTPEVGAECVSSAH
jgi:hypothetical protein